MKIRITEKQAKRLKLINESNNAYEAALEFSKELEPKLNFIFNQVKEIKVIDILENKVNFDSLHTLLSEMEGNMDKMYKYGYNYINSLEDEDLDIALDDAQRLVSDKINIIDIILYELEKIADKNEEYSFLKTFPTTTIDLNQRLR